MQCIPLSLWNHDCYYVKSNIYEQKEDFLIDTWFSSYLCLSEKLKYLFPELDAYTTFETEYTLADSSKKMFTQYSIPKLTIFNKEFENIFLTFNKDESIIGVKLLEKLWSKIEINFKDKKWFIFID